ncbi:MAG: PIG-L family deacetylase [Firmicutes bacterium]|nr:PIG-L family deacetylase [Bacillota bacterium]
MEDKRYKVLSIGAHPDDADTSAGGLLKKLADKGWEVRLLSLTDGSRGTYDPDLAGERLAEIRKAEAAASGALFGGRYDVWDIEDTRLTASVENRERLIRYIREFAPDLVITNRPNDYHTDHRNAALLVQDASYLLTVPACCPDTPAMRYAPVMLFWHDSFQKPYPFCADVVVPIDGQLDTLVKAACCHESQYFDWMYWPDNMEKASWPKEKKAQDLAERYDRLFARFRSEYAAEVVEKFGEKAEEIGHVEVFEICEYGEEPSAEFLEMLEK